LSNPTQINEINIIHIQNKSNKKTETKQKQKQNKKQKQKTKEIKPPLFQAGK